MVVRWMMTFRKCMILLSVVIVISSTSSSSSFFFGSRTYHHHHHHHYVNGFVVVVHALSITTSTIRSRSRRFRYRVLKNTIKLRKQLLVLYYRDDTTTTLASDEFAPISTPTLPQLIISTPPEPPTTTSTIYQPFIRRDVPSSIDSTTIARIVLSNVGMVVVSTMAFGVMNGIMSVTGDISSINDSTNVSLLWQINASPFNNMNWSTIVFLGCGGAFPLIYTSHYLSNHYHGIISNTAASTERIPIDTTTTTTTTTNTIRSVHYRNQMEVTNMVLQMLGRRRPQLQRSHPQNDPSTQTVAMNKKQIVSPNDVLPTTATSTTLSSIIVLSIINTMTSISSELVYRLYIPSLLLHGSVLSSSSSSINEDDAIILLLSVFVSSAMLYGFSHISWKQEQSTPTVSTSLSSASAAVVGNVDSCMLLLQQTLAGMWYSMLYMCSGSIVPSILAHYMFDMDLLTSSWHIVNNQMDYIENHKNNNNNGGKQRQRQLELESISTCTSRQGTKPSDLRITCEAEDLCQQFFLAFDSEHVGSWNERDVDRAIQYLLYNNNNNNKSCCNRNIYSTGELFHQYSTMTPSVSSLLLLSDETQQQQRRIQYTEFLQLLQFIYSTQQQTNTQQSFRPTTTTTN